MTLTAPQFFFAQDRSVADEALCRRRGRHSQPRHAAHRRHADRRRGASISSACRTSRRKSCAACGCRDAMKAKKLKEALQQMAEEGVVQVFRPLDGSPALVGVVGPLQLDVLQARLDGRIRPRDRLCDDAEFELARWIAADDPKVLDEVRRATTVSSIADDLDGDRSSRAQPVLSRLHPRARARHRLHRHQGQPRQGLGGHHVQPSSPAKAGHPVIISLDCYYWMPRRSLCIGPAYGRTSLAGHDWPVVRARLRS